MMENVYFGAAKLTLDEITFACRDLLPLDYSWWIAKHTHVSASHATPFISIIRCSQLCRNETRNMIHSITLRALWNTLDSLLQLLFFAQAEIDVAIFKLAFQTGTSLNLCNTRWNRFIYYFWYHLLCINNNLFKFISLEIHTKRV